jgi:virginiamycin B lyase
VGGRDGLGELVGAPAPRPAPVRALAIGVAVLLVLGLAAFAARDGRGADPVAVRSHGTGADADDAEDPQTLGMTEETTTTTSGSHASTPGTNGTSPTTMQPGAPTPQGPTFPKPETLIPPPPPTAAKVTRFPLPKGVAAQTIVAGSDGNMWFGYGNKDVVARITQDGVITEFRTPTPWSQPGALTLGPDGNIWFTESTGKIGRITPAGVITEFVVSETEGMMAGLTAGPDGAMWFTEWNAQQVGRLTLTGEVTHFPVPALQLGAYPNRIIRHGQAMWLTAHTESLHRIASNGTATEVPLSGGWIASDAVTVGPDGALWMTVRDYPNWTHGVGRLTNAGAFSFFPISGMDTELSDIALGPDGHLWLGKFQAGTIARLSTQGTVVEEIAVGGWVNSMAAGPGGYVWFTDASYEAVGRIKA